MSGNSGVCSGIQKSRFRRESCGIREGSGVSVSEWDRSHQLKFIPEVTGSHCEWRSIHWVRWRFRNLMVKSPGSWGVWRRKRRKWMSGNRRHHGTWKCFLVAPRYKETKKQLKVRVTMYPGKIKDPTMSFIKVTALHCSNRRRHS